MARIIGFLFPKPKWVVECEAAIAAFEEMIHKPMELPPTCFGSRKSFDDQD